MIRPASLVLRLASISPLSQLLRNRLLNRLAIPKVQRASGADTNEISLFSVSAAANAGASIIPAILSVQPA